MRRSSPLIAPIRRLESPLCGASGRTRDVAARWPVSANAPMLSASSRWHRARDITWAFAVCAEARKFHAAVVGSIIFFTSVILVAGKPLISACLRMMASSLAR